MYNSEPSTGLLLPSHCCLLTAPITCLGHVVLVDLGQPPVSLHQRPLVGIAGDPLLLQARTALPVRPRGGGSQRISREGAPGGKRPHEKRCGEGSPGGSAAQLSRPKGKGRKGGPVSSPLADLAAVTPAVHVDGGEAGDG